VVHYQEQPGVERRVTEAGQLQPRIERPHVLGRRRGRAGGQPRDPRTHRGQHALSVDLAERDEPQPGADQQRRRRVQVRSRHDLGLGAGAAERRAEHRRVMAGGETVVDGPGELADEGIGTERGGHAQRLAAHLTAGRSRLRDGLHRLQPLVQRHPAGHVAI